MQGPGSEGAKIPRHFQMRVTDGLRVHEEGALDERLVIRALLAYS